MSQQPQWQTAYDLDNPRDALMAHLEQRAMHAVRAAAWAVTIRRIDGGGSELTDDDLLNEGLNAALAVVGATEAAAAFVTGHASVEDFNKTREANDISMSST